jgi:DNA-directed RNA polymerase subunit H (RpoH/RPB5)
MQKGDFTVSDEEKNLAEDSPRVDYEMAEKMAAIDRGQTMRTIGGEKLSIDHRTDILSNLRYQREHSLARLNKIDELIALLEANGDVVKILNLTRDLL